MRTRGYLLLVGGLALLLGALVLAQPRVLDWNPDYARASARPLGAGVLYALLPAWTGAAVEPVDRAPFLRLGDTTRAAGVAYLFLTDDFGPDEAEAAKLLAFAQRGGTLFIATNQFYGPLADTLGLRPPPDSLGAAFTDSTLSAAVFGDSSGLAAFDSLALDPTSLGADTLLADTLGGEDEDYDEDYDDGYGVYTVDLAKGADDRLNFVNPALRRDSAYNFSHSALKQGLAGLDSTRTTVLGVSVEDRVTLVEIAVGRGRVLLSSTPRAFANASLTGDGDGPAYVAGVLGYLRARTILWDEHYKPRATAPQTPLRVVLAVPALRWAFWLLVAGALLFVVFRGRRWQRAIPVVEPPPNAQVAFVRTVGRLYADHGDLAGLLARKRRAFLDRLRVRLGIPDADLSPATEARVVQRSTLPADEVNALFDRLRSLDSGAALTPRDLVDLDRALDPFYDATGR